MVFFAVIAVTNRNTVPARDQRHGIFLYWR